MPTRFARLEEGLEVITRLLRSDQPVTVDGQFFQLREAVLPGPRRHKGPPVMIGGSGPKRTLPLVARFADVWNGQELGPDGVRERSSLLDELLVTAGRHPSDVRRTFNAFIVCARTPQEYAERLRGYRRYTGFATLPQDQVLEQLRTEWQAIVGTPDEIVAQIQAYEAAGITELSMQWPGVDDIEGLEIVAAEVLPRLRATPA